MRILGQQGRRRSFRAVQDGGDEGIAKRAWKGELAARQCRYRFQSVLSHTLTVRGQSSVAEQDRARFLLP